MESLDPQNSELEAQAAAAAEPKGYGPDTPGYVSDAVEMPPAALDAELAKMPAPPPCTCGMSHGHHLQWCAAAPKPHGGGQAFAQGTAKLG